MPVYEYECRDCGIRFERVQRITENPLAECTICGGSVYRVIQPVGITFKGSGFHINDYGRNGARRTSKDKPDSSTSDTTTKPESDTTTKPESKVPAAAD
jgi:putative FmdB family regulatory protein